MDPSSCSFTRGTRPVSGTCLRPRVRSAQLSLEVAQRRWGAVGKRSKEKVRAASGWFRGTGTRGTRHRLSSFGTSPCDCCFPGCAVHCSRYGQLIPRHPLRKRNSQHQKTTDWHSLKMKEC